MKVGTDAVLLGAWCKVERGDAILEVGSGCGVISCMLAQRGAQIGANCLVGMNAVLMDDAIIEDECIIGALTFVPAKMIIPSRSVAVGNPARVVKNVSDAMLQWKTEGTGWYQRLPQECRDSLRPCEPLREVPADRKNNDHSTYKPWSSREE